MKQSSIFSALSAALMLVACGGGDSGVASGGTVSTATVASIAQQPVPAVTVANPGSSDTMAPGALVELALAGSTSDSASFAPDGGEKASPQSGQLRVSAQAAGAIADTTAPSKPTTLAVAQSSASSLGITWAPSRDNVGVVRYDVYSGALLVGSTAQTNYTLTGLTASTRYYIRVKAIDAAQNESSFSGTFRADTAAASVAGGPDTTAPGAPSSLTQTQVTSSTISLNWAPSSDNVGVAGYRVYQNGALVGSPNATSFTVTGLSPATSYALTVKAVDAAGNASPASATLSASTSAATVGSFLLAAGHSQGYLPPVITFPRPDAETAATARHRINYPGQLYRIPVAVAFGAWPFRYELLTAPAGMAIGGQLEVSGNELVAGPDYGVITWANPVAGTYPISVKVTDQNSVVQTVNFTLKVAATDWVFLDPSAAANGTGTQASPFNTLASLAGLTGKAVLVRAGTVDLDQKTVGMHNLPKAWLPYGGETVNLMQARSSIGGQNASDMWFSGFKFDIHKDRTNVEQFFRLEGGSRVVFFENSFDGGNLAATGESNLAILMWTNQHVGISDAGNAWYPTVMGNTFKNVKDRDMLLGYSMRYAVVENNTVENSLTTGRGHGFYPKTNVSHFQFRRNRSIGQTNHNVLLRIDAYAGNFPMDYFDVSYNSYRFFDKDQTGDGLGAITNRDEFNTPNIKHRYFYRNTLYSGLTPASAMSVRGLNSDTVLTVSNNVLIGDGARPGEVWQVQYGGSIAASGNVTGTPAGNLVDASNKLNGSFTSHLGTKGAQVK